MKVLYIIHSCIMGGATISFMNLMQGLTKVGVKPYIVHPKPKDNELELIKKFELLGAKCYTTNIPVSIVNSNSLFLKKIAKSVFIHFENRKFCNHLIKIVKKEKIEIIHTNTGIVHGGYLLSKKVKLPHVWHLREYQTLDFNWSILPSLNKFKNYLKDSYTICITKDIQSYFELSECSKSNVVYNPSMSLKNIKHINDTKNYFLIANRVSKEKGIEDVIDVFSEFSRINKDVELKIAGFGNESYISFLKEKCLLYGIAKRVVFLGYCKNVPELMTHAKALIVSSFSEGFGRMTAEANMIGLPVIGRNTAGTKEILDQTNGGFLFNSKKEMLECMKKISNMTDKNINEFMKEPKKIAQNLFSTEQSIKNVEKIYKDILKNS